MNALGKLFTLGLLTIAEERRIALTVEGRETCKRIAESKDGHQDGAPSRKNLRRSE